MWLRIETLVGRIHVLELLLLLPQTILGHLPLRAFTCRSDANQIAKSERISRYAAEQGMSHYYPYSYSTCTPAHTRSRRSALPLTRVAPRILATTTECQIAQQLMSPSTPRSRHVSGTCNFREAFSVVWTKTLRSQSRCNIFLPQRGCLAWSVAQPRRQRHPTVICAFSGFLGVEVLPPEGRLGSLKFESRNGKVGEPSHTGKILQTWASEWRDKVQESREWGLAQACGMEDYD